MSVLDGLLDDLESQRAYVETRSPPYARILELLPDVLPYDRLEAAWAGRRFGGWYERPLLILAGLRDDALEQGVDHPLYAAIGGTARVDAVTRGAVRAALVASEGIWRKLSRRHVQTNETSRAVAWLWPCHFLAAANPGSSVQLFDIGTSAGLNLVADALPRIWRGHDGATLPVDPLPKIESRRGFDRHPLDASDEKAARWLRACVWPGQEARLQRLELAIAAWTRSDPHPELVAATAGDVPPLLPNGGQCKLAFQTVMRDYLPLDERARYELGMRRWLASNRPGSAIWVELEVAETARKGGASAAVVVHLRDISLTLASCDAHPTVLEVDDAAVRELQRHLA